MILKLEGGMKNPAAFVLIEQFCSGQLPVIDIYLNQSPVSAHPLF